VKVQTVERNLIPVHFWKPEKLDPTRFALTSPSELWKLKPSEIIAAHDPVIGDYRYIVSANLVAEANEGLGAVEHRLPTKATATP
jgi:hypothetical protein